MRTKAIVAFRDRETWRAYAPGDDYEAGDGRVAELAAAGLVEAAEGGVPDEGGLSSLSAARLRELCAQRGVDASGKATKAQLVALLEG